VDPTSPNLAEAESDHSYTRKLFYLGYLAAFSNTGSSKLSDVENDAKFALFDRL